MSGSKSFPKEREMKKILLALAFFGTLAYLYWFLTMPRTTPVYLSPTDQISQQEKPQPVHEIYDIINTINDRSSKIQSLYITEMPIHLQQGNMAAKVYGELAMEKEKNFRLKVTHRLTGREMDIGSNSSYFWFWSKRMTPPALHYAKHEDLDKTMLRTALNPAWMMESLNISPVDTENIEIGKFKDFWAAIQSRISGTGEKVTVVTLIHPTQKVVVGRYLYNQDGKLIASTEYQDFSGVIPRKILIMWYEEGITLDWDLSGVQTNVGINQQFWVMPDMRNKIDMGK
jgi:hypothetical protein